MGDATTASRAAEGADAGPHTGRPRERASAVVEAALDSIITIDRAGLVVEFNPAAEALFGWTRQEALGRDLATLIIPPDLGAAHHAGKAHYLETGEGPVLNKRIELPARRRDGTDLVVELIVVPTTYDGRPEFTGFIRDVTELRQTQERLAQSQQRYEAIVQHSARALILCAPHRGESTVISAERVLGYPAGWSLKDGFLGLVHPHDRHLADQLMAAVTSGGAGPPLLCAVTFTSYIYELRGAEMAWDKTEKTGKVALPR